MATKNVREWKHFVRINVQGAIPGERVECDRELYSGVWNSKLMECGILNRCKKTKQKRAYGLYGHSMAVHGVHEVVAFVAVLSYMQGIFIF